MSTAQIFGFSVAYLPTFIIHGAVAAGRLDVCLTEYSREPSALHVVYPSTRNVWVKVRVFIDFLVEKFGEEPYWDSGVFRFVGRSQRRHMLNAFDDQAQ